MRTEACETLPAIRFSSNGLANIKIFENTFFIRHLMECIWCKIGKNAPTRKLKFRVTMCEISDPGLWNLSQMVLSVGWTRRGRLYMALRRSA